MILLDTNVLSELTKPRPEPGVVAWLEANEQRLALPTVTLAELRYGIARLPAGKRKAGLLAFWEATRQRFTGRTFSFDPTAAGIYGDIVARAEHQGRKIKVGDGQIAAIGLAQKMKVATRDIADFSPTGVGLINPWHPESH